MSDPKLKIAMAEIAAIVKRHDIGAHICLVSETHSEFFYFIEPSWSVMRLTPNGDGSSHIRFRSKASEFDSDELRSKTTAKSVWLLLAICDIAAKTVVDFQRIVNLLKRHIKIEHEPLSGFEPHLEQ